MALDIPILKAILIGLVSAGDFQESKPLFRHNMQVVEHQKYYLKYILLGRMMTVRGGRISKRFFSSLGVIYYSLRRV